ncbi:MAG: 23S rRNA (adenine(2503)-C2)-methyltransferase, partial [Anaerolineales bacterium]
MRPSLYNLDYQELKNQIQDWNEPSYRAPQIWQGLYQNYWNNSDDFSTIPVSLRKEIDKIYALSSLYSERELHSTDGFTRKTLYRLEDNSAIETVLMGYEDRNTVCISSQVGCGVGCNFCATGNMGFIRNLSRAEIIEQVVNTAADLAQDSKNLTNVVFMGMGE